jgi:D-serine deaminase-like pyridoxal phosphate-dependent protein
MSSHWMPAQPGDGLADVDTPALILDLDRFEANLERMMTAAAATGVGGGAPPQLRTARSPLGRSACAARRSAKPRSFSAAASATC